MPSTIMSILHALAFVHKVDGSSTTMNFKQQHSRIELRQKQLNSFVMYQLKTKKTAMFKNCSR